MPAPWRCTLSRKPSPGFPHHSAGRAVFCNRCWTSSGVACGRASSSSATAPATCGDDIDVPLKFPYPPCSSGSVDLMVPPGAPRSGLKLRSGGRPYDEKLEMSPPVGCGSLVRRSVHVIVTTGPAAMRPSIRTPLAALMVTTGIVMGTGPTTVGTDEPGDVVVKHDAGGAGGLGVGRLDGEAARSTSNQRHTSGQAPCWQRDTRVVDGRRAVPVRAIGNDPTSGGGGAPAASTYPILAPSGVIVKAVRFACELSNDATPMTFLPTPGAEAPYSPRVPSLPIDATTTTPCLTRLSAALRRRVLRPRERGADAHVHDVGSVVERQFHRVEQDVGGGRALTPEYSIRVESHVEAQRR